MIEKLNMSEKEYRAVNLDSSSSLKIFAEDRRKYKKIYIDLENVKDDDDQSKALIMGSLIDCLVFEKDQFDSKFHLSTLSKAPTGKMLDFCNALVKIRKEAIDSGIDKNFQEIASEAKKEADFSWKLETVLSNFTGKDPEIYFRELITVSDKGLTTIDLNDLSNAERVVEELKTNVNTGWIFNIENSDRFIVYNQYKIQDFEIDGLPLKGMFDKLIIDHDKKTIQIYDLKCVWSVENFYYNYFLKRKSYIQAYVYKEAAKKIKEDLGLEYYTVNNPIFIVADSINYYEPLLYTMSDQDMKEAYLGFTYGNVYYKGVKQIIEEVKWAKENDKWRISKTNFLQNGMLNIKD